MIKQTLDNRRKLYYYENRCERKFERRKDMAQEDKLKALDAALAQIEKQFGKGSVMKLGDSGANMNIETVPTGSLEFGHCTWIRRYPEGTCDRGCTDRSPVVRRLWHCTWWQKYRSAAVLQALSMQSMHLTRYTRRISVWILIICTSLSRTMASRPSRSQRRWCAPGQWISLSWTL